MNWIIDVFEMMCFDHILRPLFFSIGVKPVRFHFIAWRKAINKADIKVIF